MAALNSRVYAVGTAALRAQPETKRDASLNYSGLRYISDYYTIASADELGTDATIEFFTLPKNSRVINMFLTAAVDGGATGQLKIGYEASAELDASGAALELADDDAFYASSAADWGGGALARLAIAASVAGYRKKFAAAVKVVGDCIEATADSGTNTILLEAYITVD